MQRIESLFFAPSERHGRGIFTATAIPKGSLIEICPVVVLPPEELALFQHSKLYEHFFLWGEEQDRPALGLGFASLYNHSERPNTEFLFSYLDQTIEYYALRPIQAGEEITVDYHAGKDGPVWFRVRKGST